MKAGCAGAAGDVRPRESPSYRSSGVARTVADKGDRPEGAIRRSIGGREHTMDMADTATGESPAQTSAVHRVDRRTVLQLGGAGLALWFTGRNGLGGVDHRREGQRARTRRIATRLLDTIAAGDTTAIWSMFATGGSLELPFFGVYIDDGATFEAVIGPILGSLTGLTFTAPTFVDLDDERGAILKYKGTAVVNSTGKPYNQTYISEIHVRGNKVAAYTEYFDTLVINEAYTP
jgi:uncharacterized protein